MDDLDITWFLGSLGLKLDYIKPYDVTVFYKNLDPRPSEHFKLQYTYYFWLGLQPLAPKFIIYPMWPRVGTTC